MSVAEAGLEAVGVSDCGGNELGNFEKRSAAFSGAVGAQTRDFDAQLAGIIEWWPALSAEVRKALHWLACVGRS
jgi:hypothetical protein